MRSDNILTMFLGNKKRHSRDIDPDEIFLDSSNLPQFDTHQFEGRLEQPIPKLSLALLWGFFVLVIVLFSIRLGNLEIARGESFARIAENNRLERVPIFAERGALFDRNGTPLAWNEPLLGEEFAARVYNKMRGLAHVLGYVTYPARDTKGMYYKESFSGMDGVERAYNDVLGGTNGTLLIETDAQGGERSTHRESLAENGENLVLSIDARIEEALYTRIENLARDVGFTGGAGVLMDIDTGDIIALVSYPEYDAGVLANGTPHDVETLLADPRTPLLNRAISGVYTPGSIVKPFLALAALQEQLISPDEKILSTGSIAIPHPYLVGEESVFLDWKAHGWVSMREALAVSSNVYFYEIGGGLPQGGGNEERVGLGIGKIKSYMNLLGFEKRTGVDLFGEEIGVIPDPAWKEKIFHDVWRLGDTYNTSIGQYGFQVTPLQAARAVAAIANGGTLPIPRIVTRIFSDDETNIGGKVLPPKRTQLPIDSLHYAVVREGMRLGVLEGTAQGLNIPVVEVAAKTGTAQVGTVKKIVHSWVTGFFPYEHPRYSFAIVMERGPSDNLIGALYVLRGLLEWMAVETPEYLK
ncbi:MAG: hypothetical protein A3J08_02155 [Candidatus Lloydbacteria bacterium RIFCSPLOWO2_02_FULL_51_11]|uniref:Penicillin-binding protein 2 n=2 Tax=Candidatus Lloydiibacteriota TaxID=1817910 RepID=A0A1G2DL44_9BACT|nr:MAG: hypothetical protein A3J08_02155 [Candidatus Lloydbacteria bacterium RIFCSPLOWO2_02_FULL_51_11]